MKKRLLSLVLALTILSSMLIVPVNAQENVDSNISALTDACPCGCGLSLSQVDWKPYDANENTSPMGHYYLEDDYAQTEQRTLISGSKTVIDLRGHTLTTDNAHRLFLVEGYLAVLDTVGGGRFQAKTSGTALGGVIMIREYETTDSTFELYSGTVTVDPDNKSSSTGGLIYVSSGSIFRMYGGILRDGTTTAEKSGGAIAAVTATSRVYIYGGTIMDCSSSATGGAIYSVGTTELKNCRILNCSSVTSGGAIRHTGGKLTMENVQISGCISKTSGGSIASTGVTSMKNCQLLGGTAETGNGGNIYQSGGSLTMENCDIAYGSAFGSEGGGNLYVTGSTVFTDTGSTIRDGFVTGGTGNGGGNLFIGAGTHTLTGTTIRGGVSQKYGANILNWTATTTRLIDCNIDGDVRWNGAGLSLEGKTKIGLRNNGLNLVGSSAGSIISASKLTDGAEVFVSARWGVFTNDDTNVEYFKPALRTVLKKEADGTLSGSFAAAGTEGGYCPHCYDPANPQKITWQTYTATADSNISQSGHYYLSTAVTARLNIAADTDVVIDLNGQSFTSGHRCLVLKKGATLSLLDFNGASKVTGKGGASSGSPWPGGVIYGEGACTLNIYGGTYVYSSQADKHAPKGGVIYMPAGSNVNIYGGSLDGSSYNKTEEANWGGVMCMMDGASSFTMTSGWLFGGNAYQGGCINFGASNTVNISGGVITGGSSVNGAGNIFFAGASGKSGTAQLRNCAIVNGMTTSGGGGNISCSYYTLTMDGCYLAGGTSNGYGGNINQRTGMKGQISNTLIASGRSPKGGNIYSSAIGAAATYTNCTVIGGVSYLPANSTSSTDGTGGNVFLNNGKATFVGGEIAYGTADRSAGNVYAYAGTNADGYKNGDSLILQSGKDISAPVVTGGYAKQQGGNLLITGVAQITDAVISAGRALNGGQDLHLTKAANTTLSIGAGLTGNVRMQVASELLGTPIYGNPITGSAVTTLNANIILEDKQLPVFAHDGKLYIGGATVVNANGEEVWHVNNASAVAACGKKEFVKLYTNNDLVLTKDLTVDFNGQTVSVTGDYILSGLDSTGDSYQIPGGSAAVIGQVAKITYTPDNRIYLPIAEGDTISFHRLGMALTDIVLRPEDAGIYYQASWSADSVLQSLIAEYGIVASLAGMPENDFANNSTCRAASFSDTIENGSKKAGVLIKNIMQTDNEATENKANGEMPIYATAYVTLSNGDTFVCDSATVEDDVQFSLFDFMSYLDMQISTDPTHYRKYEKRVKEFYAAWENQGMGDWVFDRLKAPQDPASDDEFNIIMIGSSYAYYYVEELYALLVEAGYENVNVCNVYYSGCPLSSHYSWWVNGQSNYQFYETNSAGRTKISSAASLEYCLARRNWDVISLQEANAPTIDKIGSEQHFANTKKYIDALLPYLESEFPQARHLWHQPWVYEVGADRNGLKITSIEQQHNVYLKRRTYDLMVLAAHDTYERVNTGEAWQLVREKYNYGQLCARLGYGDNHIGDYSHDGDIGGGQLLNACVWFEIITGLDCTQTVYVPEYSYKGEIVPNRFDPEMIKGAAHEAVEAMRNGGCAVSLEQMVVPS